MKKVISIIMVAALALLLAACAGIASESIDYSAYIPETAELVRTERDDGFTEATYRADDNARYTLYTDSANNVRVLKFDSGERSSASAITITSDDAFAEVQAIYPNAYLIHSRENRDDGAYEWKVIFSDDKIIGEYELDAETGAVLDYTIFYGVPFGFDPAKTITANHSGAEIVSLSLDEDDGRLQVDGSASLDGRRYDFTIDVDSGNITEWDWDD